MPKTLETSERTNKDYLKTRYYKGSADTIMNYLENDFKNNKIDLVSFNKDYGEISVSTDMYDMTVKVFQFSVTEVSVDLFIDSRYLFDFGKTKKVINDFYNKLSHQFPFIGLALHAN